VSGEPLLWLTAGEIARAAEGRLIQGDAERRFATFGIDSRAVRPGQLFVAIRGTRLDGHAFVAEAVAKGAAGLLVNEAAIPTPAGADGQAVAVITVADTTKGLQRIAREMRRKSGARVVAITGSAGKTTTKEVTAAFLALRFRTFRNRGNLNNHIGVPLSLLEMVDAPDMAVVELGMSAPGEIRTLVEIAEPDVRVWTNVGEAHLEYFASIDAIADAKAEILENAGPDNLLIANGDDARVMSKARGFGGRTITFAIERPADVGASAVRDLGIRGMAASVTTPAGSVNLATPLVGRGNLANVLAGIAVGLDAGIGLDDMAERASTLVPASHRGEVRTLSSGVTLIDDAYNANPPAMARTLDVMRAETGFRRRVAVLGEMLELGPASAVLHAQCGRAVAHAGIDLLITVGKEAARAMGEGAVAAGLARERVQHAETSQEAAALASALVRAGDLVLVKGSRGIGLETVVTELEGERG
jgi:UDP-N-acetylmuramoyl-tripeptide--D-alanyl-D-alanine ligase